MTLIVVTGRITCISLKERFDGDAEAGFADDLRNIINTTLDVLEFFFNYFQEWLLS
jgi:hypothetical protein